MKMAQGYVTDDGTFFESKLEAELHEAEALLRGNIGASFPQLDVDKFLVIVLEIMPTLKGFIDAYNSAAAVKLNQQAQDENRRETNASEPPTVDASVGHVSSTEEDLASLLKLPTRGPSHVPDVGSRAHAEKISKRRQKHGA